MKFRIIIFHVYRVKFIIIDPCIINNRKKIKKRMTISSEMFHDRCTSIRSFCKVGRCIVLQKKKKKEGEQKNSRDFDRWIDGARSRLISSILLPWYSRLL